MKKLADSLNDIFREGLKNGPCAGCDVYGTTGLKRICQTCSTTKGTKHERERDENGERRSGGGQG
jgi:hypothetical protein